MPTEVTEEDIELLDDLGVETTSGGDDTTSLRAQRILAGFEQITRFVAEHRRLPEHRENRDIFEQLYAVRLQCLRESQECRETLRPFDTNGLLDVGQSVEEVLDDEALLSSLGVEESPGGPITKLVHVRSQDDIKAAEEIAQRNPCQDFETIKPLFDSVQRDLESGAKVTTKYRDDAGVAKGDLFILHGQKVLVAELGDWFTPSYGRKDRRLRVVYDNGTESDLLLRSLQRALNKDKRSRRIISGTQLDLFSDVEEEGDTHTGHVYVLRSKSEHPFILEHKNVIHKIGGTGADIRSRVANAKKDPTFLLADVEIIASFKLANIRRTALEALLHKFFADARLDLELKDRFGLQVEPREWFLVPLGAIEDAIEKLKEGTIGDYRYDRERAEIVLA